MLPFIAIDPQPEHVSQFILNVGQSEPRSIAVLIKTRLYENVAGTGGLVTQ